MRFFFFFLIFSTNLWAQSTSYLPLGQVLPKKGHELHVMGRSWVSKSLYDQDGEKIDFEGDEKFSVYDVEFNGRYGATRDLEFRGILNYRQNTSSLGLTGSSETVDSEVANLQAIGVGAQFAFPKIDKRWQYTIDLFYKYTPYANPEYSLAEANAWTAQDAEDKDLILGDDGNDYAAGISIGYESKTKNYLGSKILYRRPGSELSSEINYQFEGAMAFKHAALVAGVQGIYSLEQDEKKDINDPTEIYYYSGSTFLYDSVNRQFYQPYAGINLAFGKGWRIEARGGMTSQGTSTDAGQYFSIALARRQDQTDVSSLDKKFKEYSLEASVTKVSEKKSFVIIDKGLASGVQKGTRFDFFYSDYVGGNVLLARGQVTQVNSDQAVIKITSRFSSQYEIKEGTLARSYLD
jgi:hypothetical protein